MSLFKLKNDLKRLSLLGAVIGIVGGIIGAIGGGFSLWDRLTPPGLELVQILPVCISSPRQTSDPHVSIFGISAIVRCRAGSRTVFVSALDFIGRTYLSAQDYLGYVDPSEKTMWKKGEVEAEVLDRKPYSTLLWNGWPEDQGAPIRLEPYEEKYIRFVFLAPKPFYYAQTGGPPHLGYADGTKEPERIKTIPCLWDMFKLRMRVEKDGQNNWVIWTPFGLRKEISGGALKFQLRIGPKQVTIPPENVVGFKLVELNEWKTKSAYELFHERTLGFKYNLNTEEGQSRDKKYKYFKGIK